MSLGDKLHSFIQQKNMYLFISNTPSISVLCDENLKSIKFISCILEEKIRSDHIFKIIVSMEAIT